MKLNGYPQWFKNHLNYKKKVKQHNNYIELQKKNEKILDKISLLEAKIDIIMEKFRKVKNK